MSKHFSSLLFATNLSENCRPALNHSVAIAAECQATLNLLFVLHKELPGYAETQLKSAFGEEKWEALLREHEEGAREALIGKMTPGRIGQRAMRMYCSEAGMDEDACNIRYKELVVHGGNISDTIVEQAKKNDCSLIILGAQKGVMGGSSIGSVIKGVLRSSRMPVLVVPPYQEEKM